MTGITRPETHEARISALKKVFAEQSAKAISSNKIRGVATIDKICVLAKVEKTHLYGKTDPPPEFIEQYRVLLVEMQTFNKNFLERKKKVKQSGVSDEIKLEDAVEDNHALLREVIGFEARVKLLENKNRSLLAEKTQLQAITSGENISDEKITLLPDVTVNIICPDDHLERDGKYRFHDPKERKKAWHSARTEFAKLMKRRVPQRVYLLMGPPCSGKSEWAKSKKINPNRHAVIIDATNLTAGDRASWIAQALKANNVKICVVRFIVDNATIAARNSQRHHKMIDTEVLQEKLDQLEEVDVEWEEVDEMLFVRMDNGY
ncbi:AAA family ATPase [Paraglaciecola polaris]|uniref:Uncharacterized protein n=1 Tax=Paraglaciecola polaris LMG 21857 TaxID=1129793 RepID=K6YHY2_9ALTE|nr:AAA family ATPase [Paraglaciecola polaris]GAC32304.1 hypothetical protein GPLA_1390 [Paraglaciecola polaris LMG 21857]